MKKRKKRILITCAVTVMALTASAFVLLHNYEKEINIAKETREYDDIAITYLDNDKHNDKISINDGRPEAANTGDMKNPTDGQLYEFEYSWMNFEALKRDYRDIAAWITVPYSPINYPVMFSKGNYYIDHDIYGNKSYSGAIFTYDNQTTVPMDNNLVMYGHNLWNGSMFSYLVQIYNNGYVTDKARNKVYLQTEEGLYIYEMFAAYRANVNDDYARVNFINENDFIEFCNDRQNKASGRNQNHMEFNENDKIVTLITCASGNDDGIRMVVHAKLLSFVENR